MFFPWFQATVESTLKENSHSTEIFEKIEVSSSDIDAGPAGMLLASCGGKWDEMGGFPPK